MIKGLENEFEFLKNNYNDYYFCEGNKNILISAPHAVPQLRDGNIKSAEPETALIALFFKQKNYPCIIKTTNNNDDANHTLESNYKTEIFNTFNSGKVKFLLDLHQLNSKREMDICLGLGGNDYNNLLKYSHLSNEIKSIFEKDGFITEINNPFGAGKPHTNAGYIARKGYPAIQLEINSRIVFNVDDENFNKLLITLEKLLCYLDKNIKD